MRSITFFNPSLILVGSFQWPCPWANSLGPRFRGTRPSTHVHDLTLSVHHLPPRPSPCTEYSNTIDHTLLHELLWIGTIDVRRRLDGRSMGQSDPQGRGRDSVHRDDFSWAGDWAARRWFVSFRPCPPFERYTQCFAIQYHR